MKYIIWAIAIVLCFFLGRIMYVPLGPALLAKDASARSDSPKSRPTVIFGSGSNELRISIDLNSIGEREFPQEVILKKRALVAAKDGSQETPLEADSSVRVIERNGLNLVISAGGPLQGLVPIENTDFTERVIEYRAQRHFAKAIAQNPPAPAPEPAPGPGPGPAPEPAPEPTPAPPTVAVNDPTPTPTPTDPEAAPADPEPTPQPEPAPAGGALNEAQIVEAMKASVQGGAVKEFTMAQVQGWKAGEEETVDGESYQTGMAAYKAETIFGVKTVQAKALIKGGKVVKWVYAKTGMEIR